MKQVFPMLLIGFSATICGCDSPQQPPMPAKRAVAQGILPPTPPNCPDLPEVVNLKLGDGRIADVRIIRDANETFYVPFSWYLWEAGRNSELAARYWEELKTREYDYQIHEIECPGVIHAGQFNRSTPPLHRSVKGSADATPNISQDSTIDRIVFASYGPGHPWFDRSLSFEDLNLGNKGTGEAVIRLSRYHWATFDYFIRKDIPDDGRNGVGPIWEEFRSKVMATATWKSKAASARDLYRWLKTAPKDRVNDRIFKLGAEDR